MNNVLKQCYVRLSINFEPGVKKINMTFDPMFNIANIP